jgi:hypothetical protein
MEVVLRFPVGRKYCIANMKFEQGEDVTESLRHFFLVENIPPYLEVPIFSCIYALFQEEKTAQIHESDTGHSS